MSPADFPRLRPVEVQPARNQPGVIVVSDRSLISTSALTVSSGTLALLSLMDGRHSREDIQARFMLRTGRMLFSEELDGLLQALDQALLLEGHRFEGRLGELTRNYRALPRRPLRDSDYCGGRDLGAYLDEMLTFDRPGGRATGEGLAGLIAPHLDYARGRPCYAAAYADLAARTEARRFVILGTNHFGRATSVVGTRKDFETPWGDVPHDEAFMRRMDDRCDVDLCEQEFDHLREHSIELQVILLKRLLGDRPITLAPYLCPDPCGETGTAPRDGRGVDLRRFAEALRAELEADGASTCVIAGADLSHVGRFFQDDRDLNKENLRAVEESDRRALGFVEAEDAEAFRACVAGTQNATNICSVGCIYALGVALRGRARPQLLRYHQALTREAENCVTCAAVEYTE